MEVNRNCKALDLYRLMGMFLVMWGHLIGAGSQAYEIPGVIAGALPAPIITDIGNLGLFEAFLYYRLHTQPAVLGVVMFFICSGYLIPSALERYNRREFLVNRVFRIFPLLVVSCIMCGAIVFLSQGITFTLSQYLTSMTLTFQISGTVPVMTLLWTLSIEMLFYLVAAAAGRMQKGTILSVYVIIAALGLLYREFPNRHFYNLFYNFRYIGFILLGSMLFCVLHEEKRPASSKVAAVSASFLANLLIFQINRDLFADETTYPNFFSHLIPLLVLVCLLALEGKLDAHIPKCVFWLSHLSYPVFLMHVCVGLTCMYWLSRWGVNHYLVAFAGFLASFIVAGLMFVFVEKPAIKWCRQVIEEVRRDGPAAVNGGKL